MTEPEEPTGVEPESTPTAATDSDAPETAETDESVTLPDERHSRTTELAARLRQSALAQVEAARAAQAENPPAPPTPAIPALDDTSLGGRVTPPPGPAGPVVFAPETAEPEPAEPESEAAEPEDAETAAEDVAAPEVSAPADEPEPEAAEPVAPAAAVAEAAAPEPDPEPEAPATVVLEPAEAEVPVQRRSISGLRLATAAVALLTVVAIVLLVLYIQKDSHNSAVAKARVAALAAAKTETAAALTYNYQSLDTDFAHAEAGMSTSFKANFAALATKTVGPLAMHTHAVTTGTIAAAGVISASTSSAEILVFADQTVENKLLKATSRLDRSVIEVSMVKQGGHWVINDLKPF